MKELQEQGSKWRSARWKEQGGVQKAGVGALFDRPFRRCTEFKAQNQNAARDPFLRRCDKQESRRLFPGAGFVFWRRSIALLTLVRSPAARAGLTIYVARRSPATSLTAVGVPPCRASSRTQHRNVKTPLRWNPVGFLVLATSYSRTAYRRTTIGAAAFHCRVRNGNGWCHCAIVTRN